MERSPAPAYSFGITHPKGDT
jgi:hypothetical protein